MLNKLFAKHFRNFKNSKEFKSQIARFVLNEEVLSEYDMPARAY